MPFSQDDLDEHALLAGTPGRRYRRALALFDEGYYFECHDVLESIWIEGADPERRFYQGLLQVAAALHKVRMGEPTGARKLFERGAALLRGFRPASRGVNLVRLLADTDRFLALAEQRQGEGLEPWPSGVEPPRLLEVRTAGAAST